jgi:hypothetical protein
LSYLRSLQRHAAVEYGEVRRVLALKRGVGDHTPERFADHELGYVTAGSAKFGGGPLKPLGLSGFTALRGTIRISVCERAIERYAAMALMKRSPKMTAN